MNIKVQWLLVAMNIFLIKLYCGVSSTRSFVVSFQNSGGWSTEEWVEFDKPIPVLKEFTACHWEKTKYFSSDIMNVWAYCIANKAKKSSMHCVQLYTTGNGTTTNQQLLLLSWVEFVDNRTRGREVGVNIKDYRHRNWNHICWSYSSISNTNKFYYNGKLLGVISMENGYPIPTAGELEMASFIIGQEPDAFNGKFSVAQLFNGEVSELNLWDTILSDDDVLALGHCKSFLKGNILPWQKNWIVNHGARILDVNSEMFCKEDGRLIVFPKRQPKPIGRDLCNSHGGQLITPSSKKENDKMMRLLMEHKDVCMEKNPENPANTGKAVWLGLTKENNTWYSLHADKKNAIRNFAHWGKNPNMNITTDCSFVNTNGEWNYENQESCLNLQLCTICKVIGNPVFTINGLCQNNVFDYNYYLVTDDKNMIKYYEGYKSSNIVKKDNSWVFVLKRGNGANTRIVTMFENDDYFFPVGRVSWNMYDPKCGIKPEQKKKLSMSKCRFGEEFTCDSGNCIALDKRCNQNKDCDDESDENGCRLVQFPETYRKIQPPAPQSSSEPLPIYTFIEIIGIDEIDTLNMHVGLTLKIYMQWKDARLTFMNLIRNSGNKLTPEIAAQLWNPLQYVIHENALIGEIYPDSINEVEIRSIKPPIAMNPNNAIQDILYEGAYTIVTFKQRYRLLYRCRFSLRYFPFDTQTCKFIMKMENDKFSSVSLEQDKTSENPTGVTYVGPENANEFRIDKILAYTGIIGKHTYFNFTIKLERIYTDQMIETFFPTMLLWMLAYFTLFIKSDHFNERIMVSLTVLLVLAALLTPIKSRIPPTSYFKYIDMWFLWYITYIFSITLFHIILHSCITKIETNRVTIGTRSITVRKQNDNSRKDAINDIAKFLLLIPFIVFNCLYFALQFSN